MNTELIKELFEEATKSSWPRPGKFTTGEYDYNLGKFAELIIRECAFLFDPKLTVSHEERVVHTSILSHFGLSDD